jgi:hypothetical protein
MVNFLTPPGLEGLFDLDSKGVDIKPTLLRVLTDQYLRVDAPSADEEQRYCELATRLLSEVDIATRAAVSVRLAARACAPRSILLELARDVIEVAEPVLLHSPNLTPADCEAIVAERGAVYAEILARRGKSEAKAGPVTNMPTATEATALLAALTRQTRTAAGLDMKSTTDTARVGATDSDTDTAEAQTADAYELCELFFAAGSSERRLILLNLDFAHWTASQPPLPLQRADVWRMETAALRHNTATVTQELERALGISHRQARRIVDDDQGEPIVAAAKAMSLPADVLQRILLFMNPRVGQSVDRVYELANLYSEISVEAARRLVTILRAAEPAGRKPFDTRALYSAVETAQRALSEIAGKAARKPEAPKLRRAARD